MDEVYKRMISHLKLDIIRMADGPLIIKNHLR